MESDTQNKRPDWLTDSRVAELRQEIKECDNPYTDAEVEAIPLDGDDMIDFDRLNTHHAIKILKKYNLL